MHYQITSDNIDTSPSMTALAHEKLKKLENRLTHIPEGLKSARIVMNSAKDDQFTTKIHLTIKGKEYFAEVTGFTLEHTLIEAVGLLDRDLQTDKIIETEENWDKVREAKHFDPVESLEEDINETEL